MEVTLVLFMVGLGGIGLVLVLLAGLTLLRRAGLLSEHSSPRHSEAVAAEEMRALREEVASLRREQAETVLGFDSSLDSLDRRIRCLEERPSRTAEAPAQQVIGRSE
jgi:hypothetical protein